MHQRSQEIPTLKFAYDLKVNGPTKPTIFVEYLQFLQFIQSLKAKWIQLKGFLVTTHSQTKIVQRLVNMASQKSDTTVEL